MSELTGSIRDYTSTGDTGDLARYTAALKRLNPELTGLQALIAENANQQNRFRAFDNALRNLIVSTNEIARTRSTAGVGAANEKYDAGVTRHDDDRKREPNPRSQLQNGVCMSEPKQRWQPDESGEG